LLFVLIVTLVTIGGQHLWAFVFSGSLLCLVVFVMLNKISSSSSSPTSLTTPPMANYDHLCLCLGFKHVLTYGTLLMLLAYLLTTLLKGTLCRILFVDGVKIAVAFWQFSVIGVKLLRICQTRHHR